ncbi:hypothetical protein ESZ53_13560 [Salinibacterium sp. UTAS2018]|uniref:hypothetical protein n=1 Tax=Salinibacterium sp. UTAS2018 TaxID=2508880 RepID=UPI0010095CB0|nr:hypothetical protein [Salinibacterium sp. UTAS2018]QAV71371.1 hypothetical protein ESZ53_13560 [Salinibacterium sp. UTAS2018]
MLSARHSVSASVALVLALAATPALAGCSGENPIGGIVEQATGGNLSLGGTEIPEGFPSTVPLTEGDVQFAIAAGEGDSRGYNITIATGAQSPLDAIEDDFAAAGYESQVQASGSDGAGSVIFSSDDWNVAVIVASTDDGYTANYTVAPAGTAN